MEVISCKLCTFFDGLTLLWITMYNRSLRYAYYSANRSVRHQAVRLMRPPSSPPPSFPLYRDLFPSLPFLAPLDCLLPSFISFL